MNSYKLVNSREVQEKAEVLGYFVKESEYNKINPFIWLHDDGRVVYGGHHSYIDSISKEITQKDFLALPEPLKKNDWVLIWKKTHHELWLYDGEMELNDGQYVKLSNEQVKSLNMEIYN